LNLLFESEANPLLPSLAFRSIAGYTDPHHSDSERSEAVLKVLVLGAGVVGVTTAWYLAKSGVEVG
jgi:heterodisulfide reductase subunit A-like polyferredoxin